MVRVGVRQGDKEGGVPGVEQGGGGCRVGEGGGGADRQLAGC